MNTRNRSIALTAMLIAFSLAAPSAGASEFYRQPHVDQLLNNGIAETWSSTGIPDGEYIEISANIGDDGKIYEPDITHYSTNEQSNAECLETICALSPVVPKGWPCHLNHQKRRFGAGKNFKPNFKPKFNGEEVIEFLKTHSQSKDDPFVVIHRIPLSLLRTNPGLFSESELRNPNNLMTVPIGRSIEKLSSEGTRNQKPYYVLGIGNFYAYWSTVISTSGLTKEKVLEAAKTVGINVS